MADTETREGQAKAAADGLATRRWSAWVEPVVIGLTAAAVWWITDMAWVANLTATLMAVRVILREAGELHRVRHLYYAELEAELRKTRTVLGWLLARSDDPDWLDKRRAEIAKTRHQRDRASSGGPQLDSGDEDSDNYLDPDWLERRIARYEADRRALKEDLGA